MAGHRCARAATLLLDRAAPTRRREEDRVSLRRLVAVTVAVAFGATLVAGCTGPGEEAPPTFREDEAAGTTTTNPLVPKLGPAPPPVVASGRGSARRTIEIGEGPAIVSGRFAGAGRARVLIGADARVEILLFDARTPLAGERAVWWLDADLYDLTVFAPARWRLTFTAWRPSDSDRVLEGALRGRGPTVVPVRVGSPSPTSVAVDYAGRAAFSVLVLPFSPYSEEITLADRPRGPVDARFPVSLAPGDYLMQVSARGPWRLMFGD